MMNRGKQKEKEEIWLSKHDILSKLNEKENYEYLGKPKEDLNKYNKIKGKLIKES